MIRYHGAGLASDNQRRLWTGRHAMVSFAYKEALPLAAEVAHSFALDNGAFTAWRQGAVHSFKDYASWVSEWRCHPGFDWALIPDKIDGDEHENWNLIEHWLLTVPDATVIGVPVFHLHESFGYLRDLIGHGFRRIALGSSGEYSTPGTSAWWARMNEVRQVLVDERDRPLVKLHGLRMMNPTIFSWIPFASVDSTNADRNVTNEQRWQQGYLAGVSKEMRTLILTDRFENHASATVWKVHNGQEALALLG